MIFVNIVTTLCLIAFVVEIIYFVHGFKGKSHKEQVTYVRGFKKGKFLAIYITSFPLFYMGIMHEGHDCGNSIFISVKSIVDLVVLKYDVTSIETLICENLYYRLVVYFCFALALVNAIVFTASLFIQQIWCKLQERNALKTDKDKLYLFGNNPQNIAIYLSDGDKRNKVIIDDISEDDRESLYMDYIAYISTASLEKQAVMLIHNAKKLDREYIFIINTGEDERNIQLCTTIIDEIEKSPDEERKKLFHKIKVFVFGDPRFQAIYEDIVSSSYGCIRYVNKYQKMAIDFIDRYPLALFMDKRHIDYKTSLIRDGVNINVAFIGFGKTNQQIFLTSVANNQFLTAGADEYEPVLKPVNYYFFDKDPAENNKNLNHSYYRYENERDEISKKPHLPFPSDPAKIEYLRLDINSKDFYHSIKERVAKNPQDANFIVIAFGSDLENLDMAQKLVEKREEWGIKNLIIFVKVRVWHKEQTLLEQSGCYFIGNENDTVYDIEEIVGDRLYKMSMMRNATYDIEYDITHNYVSVVDDEYIQRRIATSYEDWYKKKSQMDRESSLYGCLSLRSKLNLMGLDYCLADANDLPALTEKEYFTIYAADDMPRDGGFTATARGKRILYYDIKFNRSRRRNMAIHEHQRWNSFMISKGVVPATLEQIHDEMLPNEKGVMKHSNGKNPALRRHGNLTTFDGLVTFREMVAKRDSCSEAEADVIKYDYQILDDAYWLLSTNGYKIVKKINPKE